MPSFMSLPSQPPISIPGDDYPLFGRISIETLSFCNRDCHFCPLHWSQDERGRKAMAPELFDKIVRELEGLEFDGVAQMFLLSEPTIDKTMPAKLSALRTACPKVTTYASSNGDLFDSILRNRGMDAALEKVASFYDAGLTVLNLNIYDPGEEQAERYRALYTEIINQLDAHVTENKYRTHNVKRRWIALTDMRLDQNGNQGITNTLYIKTKAERANIVAPQRHCARTQRHIVVEWDGNVPICCAIDVTDKSLPSLGNINEQSLLEVWNGGPINKYRYFTQSARRILPGCSTCTHSMAFPHIVRKVEPHAALKAAWEKEAAK